MTGYIQPGGKCFMVNQRFGTYGVPRLYRSSGTSDKHTWASIKTMLAELKEWGTPDAAAIVRRLADGSLTFIDAVATYRAEGKKGMAKHAEPDYPITEAAFQDWVKRHDVKPATRESYHKTYKAVAKHIRVADTMKTLPTVMKRYRDRCVLDGKNFRAWDTALAVCQAWVKGVMDDEATPYRQLRKLERFDRKPDPRKKRYFSPRDIRNVCDRVPEDVAAVIWGMACYGMNPKEYLIDGWAIDGQGVHIYGEKHAHRNRIVPLLPDFPPVKPAIHFNYHTLHNYVRAGSDKEMTPNAPRNAYPRWLGEAGIPWNRVKMYQGHAQSEMTDTYAMHHVAEAQLIEDGKKLQAWITAQLVANPAAVIPEKPKATRKPRRKKHLTLA